MSMKNSNDAIGNRTPWFQAWRTLPQSSVPFEIEPIVCPETSVRNYQYTLRNIPEERRSHVLRGGRLKSLIRTDYFLARAGDVGLTVMQSGATCELSYPCISQPYWRC